jgi:FAD/FMN-containing dehydrogenase
MSVAPEAVAELEASFRGEIVRPDSAGYDEARKIFNAMIDRRPALIARCSGVADVIEAVRHARANDLQIAVRGGGHGVPGYAVCDDGIVIDMRPMKGIRVDPAARTARAQAGCNWGDLDRETQAFGLAVTGGRMSDTGIAGLTLGSGSGWLERKYGLTVDNVISADVVTADGELVTASATANPELFWGLRGGGGNFGIVTEFEYRLHPVGPLVYAGMWGYPAERAKEIMRVYRDFIEAAPDDIGGCLAFLTAPPEPFVPEEVRGTQMLAVVVFYAGPAEEGEDAFGPLREQLGDPAVDVVQPMPYTALQQMIDPGNPPGLQQYWKAGFLHELGDEAIEALAEKAWTVPSPLTAILFLPMGGAIARVPDGETPLGQRDAGWNYHLLSMWPDPAENESQIAWTREFASVLEPYATGGFYPNMQVDEGQAALAGAYGPEKWEQLVELKGAWDPENVFCLNQNIKPGGAA